MEMSDYTVDPLFIDRAELSRILKENVMIVDFRKADGTPRIMRCTLKSSYLPSISAPVKKARLHSNESISVWDVDLSAWRSFRIDSISSIKHSELV
jgi:hypothetical protein